MNYHIMTEDKFIDGFIKDIRELGELENNTFLIRSDGEDTLLNTSEYEVSFIGNTRNSILKALSVVKSDDIILVHWYDPFIAQVIEDFQNTLVVFFWGAEFYQTPFWYHYHWIYDNKTKAYLKKVNSPKVIWRKNVFKLVRNVYDYLNYWIKTPRGEKEFAERNRQVQKIDFLTITEENDTEFQFTKKLFPGSHYEKAPAFYDVNYDLAIQIIDGNSHMNPRILIGNSATAANNHLEAFEVLKGLDVDIYCPLSYGEEEYRDFIIEKGKHYFGDRFHAITDFMSRDAYVQFLSTVDVVFMYHNRSQAWGNIATALTLGKAIFIKSINPLSQFMVALGMTYYEADGIRTADLNEIIALELGNRDANQEKLKKSVSKQKRLSDLKKLLDRLKKN
jgi:dTDP-N-acetylfucosamine:lipid II N-acetylfucosaminyltransferase